MSQDKSVLSSIKKWSHNSINKPDCDSKESCDHNSKGSFSKFSISKDYIVEEMLLKYCINLSDAKDIGSPAIPTYSIVVSVEDCWLLWCSSKNITHTYTFIGDNMENIKHRDLKSIQKEQSLLCVHTKNETKCEADLMNVDFDFLKSSLVELRPNSTNGIGISNFSYSCAIHSLHYMENELKDFIIVDDIA